MIERFQVHSSMSVCSNRKQIKIIIKKHYTNYLSLSCEFDKQNKKDKINFKTAIFIEHYKLYKILNWGKIKCTNYRPFLIQYFMLVSVQADSKRAKIFLNRERDRINRSNFGGRTLALRLNDLFAVPDRLIKNDSRNLSYNLRNSAKLIEPMAKTNSVDFDKGTSLLINLEIWLNFKF
ncbi:hypothetical protein BpHYR1_024322 [Brachionus plicatilis]|uniref:Uncharacterized protein n=1 Tax=Brachionus plicatilis TaxID=10195 RepID=A0A3M7QAN0_BRAPC|nr:hypothetical protein BpHYR1_024322 [Brachionus plicatilis]